MVQCIGEADKGQIAAAENLTADDLSAPRFAPGSRWSGGEHLPAKNFLLQIRPPRWRALTSTATRPSLLPAVSGHRRRSPLFIHATRMWLCYCRGGDVANPWEQLSLDTAVDRQLRPTMVITMAATVTHHGYKFTTSSLPSLKSTELRPSSLTCEAIATTPISD
jgi:hypothetical protein